MRTIKVEFFPLHAVYTYFQWLNSLTIGVPDGGDGGDGGDVYFRSTGRLSSLYDLRRAHFFGNNGKSGLVST